MATQTEKRRRSKKGGDPDYPYSMLFESMQKAEAACREFAKAARKLPQQSELRD